VVALLSKFIWLMTVTLIVVSADCLRKLGNVTAWYARLELIEPAAKATKKRKWCFCFL